MNDAHRADVIGFYDTHPINEQEILAKLAARGASMDALTEHDLIEFDQDHYGGIEATEALAAAAGLAAGQHVLDVCSGMGGPARWFAHRHGCRVTGIDLTASRVVGAGRLTERVGLQERVTFHQGDATAMPFADATFDAVVGQEAWCHIPAKPALLDECVRVTRRGGVIAFTDEVLLAQPTEDEQRGLTEGMVMPSLPFADAYVALLRERGCVIEHRTDLSDVWVEVLQARHRMYRSLRDTTVAKFGEARFLEYDRVYGEFVGLFTRRTLGGIRVVARRG